MASWAYLCQNCGTLGHPVRRGMREGPPKRWVTISISGVTEEVTACSFKCAREFLAELEKELVPTTPPGGE